MMLPSNHTDGTIYDYVRRLWKAANDSREVVDGEWNGTPVTARPGMSFANIFDDWKGRRLEIQGNEFAKKVEEFAVTVVGKKIISAVALFGRDREPVGTLFYLDDGSSFVADGVRKG